MVIAAVPFVVTALAMVFTVGGDYHPSGDLAMTEMHIRDIGHHEVLIGLWSRWSWSHLGPMQFYLVAPFYWLTGDRSIGMVLGALTLNLASIVGILVISRRRGGTPLVGVFVTSFLVQTHIGFLALAVPLFALGLGALVVRLVRARRGQADPEDPGRLPDRRGPLRAAAVSAVVFGIVWLPPVLDRIWYKPSNLGNAWRYFRHPYEDGHTLLEGWRVASAQFGAEPEWLTGRVAPQPYSGQSRFLFDAPRPVWLLAVSGAREGTPHADDVEVVDTLTAPLLERYAGIDEPLVVDEAPNIAIPWYTRGIALQLERHGIPVEIAPNIGFMFARSQVHNGGPVAAHLLVATNEQVEALLETRNVHMLARWLAVPLEVHERLTADLEDLEDQFDDGEISQIDYSFGLTVIGAEMAGDRPDTTANDVAVFIDERPRDEGED